MKRKVLLSAGIIASLFAFRACSLASGDPYTRTPFSEDAGCNGTVCNRAAPLDNTEGASLNSVDAYAVRICAEPTKTISDGGSLWIYVCRANDSLCGHNFALDQPIAGSGERCQDFPDFKVGFVTSSADTVVVRPQGVAVTGTDGGSGNSLTTTIFTHLERYH